MNLPAGIYTVTFYDMDYNNVPYTTEYVVKLTNQSVTGLSSPTLASISTVAMLSSILTTSCTVCTSSKSLHYCL